MTFSLLKTAVIELCDRDPSSVITNRVGEWINERQRQICLKHKWSWLQRTATWSTVDGTATYLPTAGVDTSWTDLHRLRVQWVKRSDNNLWLPLTQIERGEGLSLYSSAAASENKPLYWSYEITDASEALVALYPTPDTVYSMAARITGILIDLVVTTNESNILTLDYPYLLLHGAAADGFRVLHEREKAMEEEAIYETMMQQAWANDNKASWDDISVIVPRLDVDALGQNELIRL